MRRLAEVCSLSPRWGSCHPPLLLVTVRVHQLPTPSLLHSTVPLLSLSSKQGFQPGVPLQLPAHPAVIPAPPGSSSVPLCALSPAPCSGVLLYLIFHSCASQGLKMEKAWIVTIGEGFSSCFPARAGNWTSKSRTRFCSCPLLCHCAAGCHTGGMYAGAGGVTRLTRS